MTKASVSTWGVMIAVAVCGGVGAGAQAEPEPVDPLSMAREAVRAAEVAFAASVAAKDRAKFTSLLADDAVFIGGGELRGRSEIVAGWDAFFASDAPEFLWHPEIVEISGEGTLGLTRGPWTMKGLRPDGTPIDRKGTFTSIWRKQPDGSWRVTFDAGCPECPACGG